jgi:hypothetical protein
MSSKSFKTQALTYILIMLVLSVITLLIGLTIKDITYRGYYLTLTLGGIVLATTIIYAILVELKDNNDIKGIATSAIQALWISTSMGLGYIVTAYAPYFQIPSAHATTLFIIGWVMLLLGMYSLLKLSKESGVSLAV